MKRQRTGEVGVVKKTGQVFRREIVQAPGGLVLLIETPLSGRKLTSRRILKAASKRGELMLSSQVCEYIGCTLRHLYWLIEKRKFPFYFLDIGDVVRRGVPRYVFLRSEVDRWLKGYRGRGKRLGLQRGLSTLVTKSKKQSLEKRTSRP